MIPLIARVATDVTLSRVSQPRSEDPFVLRQAFAPFCPARVIPDAQEACRLLLAEVHPDDAIVVCGSLFLVGEILPLFRHTETALPRQNSGKEG